MRSILHRFLLVLSSCTSIRADAAGACDAASVGGACSANSAPEAHEKAIIGPTFRTCELSDQCLLCHAYRADCQRVPLLETETANPPISQALTEKIALQVQARLDKRIAAGEKLQILHIGPNDFAEEVHIFQGLLGHRASEAEIVLVEPNKAVHERIKKHAGAVNFSSVEVLLAGAGGFDGDLSFWWYEPQCTTKILNSVADALELDEQIIQAVVDELCKWTTMDKARVPWPLADVSFINWLMENTKYSPEAWDQGVALQILNECVLELEVPVLAPPSLLESAGFSFDRLDILMVESEGFDIPILKAFLARPDFDPAWIMFEWTGFGSPGSGGRQGLADLMTQLSKSGFDVHHVQQDMMALRENMGYFRTCDPADPCVLCNAHMDDCKKVPFRETEMANPPASPALSEKIAFQVQARLDKRFAAGEKLQIVHIGPNDFADEMRIFQGLLGHRASEAEIVLVEPNKAVHERIKKHAGAVNFSSVEVLLAGAGGFDGDLSFWWYEPQCTTKILNSVADALELDERKIESVVEELSKWTTMDKSRVAVAITFNKIIDWLKWNMKYSPETWDQGVALQIINECIQELHVPVLGPLSLMEAAGFSFDRLDILMVDSEGFDIPILTGFLARPDFDPAWIMFEWTGFDSPGSGGRQGLADLMAQLSKSGYDVHHVRHDMMALRPLKKLAGSVPFDARQ